MITVEQVNNANDYRKSREKSVDYSQMYCFNDSRSCSLLFFHAEAGIVLSLFLNFEPKLASCSYKIVLIKNKCINVCT